MYVGSDNYDIVIEKINSPIKRGSGYIVLPDHHDVESGDTLFLYNPNDFSFSPHRYYYRQGEAVFVSAIQNKTAILSGAIIDEYPEGCMLIKPKLKKMKITGNYKITYPKINGTHSYSPDAVGLLAEQLIDSDLTGLSITLIQGSQAFILRRSVNCFGSGLHNSQAIDGPSTLGLDSGLGIANCQGVYLSGIFSGERHGCSISGTGAIGGIVTRFCSIGGEILSTGRDSKLSADWHGNTEYCNYYGRMNGVTAGGNHNSVLPNSLIESLSDPDGTNSNEPTIGFREINGTDFKFSNIRLVSNNTPSKSFKGVVDLGSISSQLNNDVKEGGCLDFSGTTFVCKETEHALKLRSDNFNLRWGVNLTNAIISSSGVRPIWIQPTKGEPTNYIMLTGTKFPDNANELYLTSLPGSSYGIIHSGSITIDMKGMPTNQGIVSLPHVFPSDYSLSFTLQGNYRNRYGVITNRQNNKEFQIGVYTLNGSDSSEIIHIQYILCR